MADPTRFWIAIQLHPWSVKTKRTAEIAREIRKKFKRRDLDVFYGVAEDDITGEKYESPYNEYFFVEFIPGFDYPEVKDEDFFIKIVRTTLYGPPAVFLDRDLDPMRDWMSRIPVFPPGTRVQVINGPLKNYPGVVLSTDDPGTGAPPLVTVQVMLGDRDEELIAPITWVRKKPRKKKPPGGSHER